MKKEFTFIFGLILAIGFVLAIPLPPPSPHQFYGEIDYNGQLIQDGCSIIVKTSDFTKDCIIQEGKYGYNPNLCIAESYEISGETVEFYIEDKKIGENEFIDKEVTKLDFSIDFVPDCPADYCGDGICNNGETCSTCAQDCGVCQDNDEGSSSGSSPLSLIREEAVNTGSDTNSESSDENQGTVGGGMTGGVIGSSGSGTGIVLILVLIIIILGIGVILITKKKSKK